MCNEMLEENNPNRSDKSFYRLFWNLIKSYKINIFLILFFNGIAMLVYDYIMSELVGIISARVHYIEMKSSVIMLVMSFSSIWFLGSFFQYIASWFFSRSSVTIENSVRKMMFLEISKKPYDFFLHNSENTLAKSIDIMTHNVFEIFESLVLKIIPSMCILIVFIVKFFSENKIFGFLTVSFSIIQFSISFFFFKRLTKVGLDHNKIHGKINTIIGTSFKNQKIKEYFNLGHVFNRKLDEAHEENTINHRKNIVTIAIIKFSKGLVFVIIMGFIFNGFILYLFYNGSIDEESFLKYFQLAGGLIHLVWHAGEKIPELFDLIAKSKVMMHFFTDNNQEYRKLKVRAIVNCTGDIKIENLNFKYKDYNDLDRHIFKDFSLHIKPKDRILILGYSGVGKSTFIDLLNGILISYQGNILYDNINLREISSSFIENNIALISNNGILEGTIGYNISFEENFDREKMKKILEKVQLDIDPDKSIESSSTSFLSEGEKQRVLIARGFWREGRNIVIADEPFKGLDFKNKNNIKNQILQFSENKTLILIDHGLSVCKDMDKIIFFGENNQAFGTFEELYKSNVEFQEFIDFESKI